MPEFNSSWAVCCCPSTLAYAGLKPDIIDCDAKKAARNSAMGACGRCDPKKASGETKKDAVHTVQDSSREETHDSVENKVGDSCNERKHCLNQDGG